MNDQPDAIVLEQILIYPVKGFRGIAVPRATLDRCGLVGDRRFLVVDPAGNFLSQRTLPRMALVHTTLAGGRLTLTGAGLPPIEVAVASDASAALREVTVWQSPGLLAEDCGDAAATALTRFLGAACRLVRAGARFVRPLVRPGKARPDDVFTFADAYPFMGLTVASLADLNARLTARGESALPMNRFRPNFVFRGGTAHAEDTWARISIGAASFRAGGPCGRCPVTTTDQESAARGAEPLRLLATYRRDPAQPTIVNFGQNFIHETFTGEIAAGAVVQVEPAAG